MDKSFFTKVTGDTITAGRLTLATLRLTHRLGFRRIFSFVYRHFTKEGRNWKTMETLSHEGERVVLEMISDNPTLSWLERRMQTHVEVSVDRRTWWALLEIFEDHQVTYMVQDFLKHGRSEDLQAFGRTCTGLADQMLRVSSTHPTRGAVVTEPDYIRAVAIQQLAACFATFPLLCRTEDQIRHCLKAY
jgi:hypothetical protein